jgi:3-hydroxyacyl-[acyl-carrier-protein] dehydratase
MMLKDNFYKVVTPLTHEASTIRCRIALNKDHDIFKGHFPGLPVVPGVCMVAIIKEVLESGKGRKYTLGKASTTKFLSLINPLVNSEVDVEVKYAGLEDGTVQVEGVIADGTQVFFKISRAVYK